MKRILLIDDNRPVLSTLDLILTQAGYTVFSFCDPIEAHHHIRGIKPDLVLLDPQSLRSSESGIDVAFRLASTTPRCRFVIYAGSEDVLDVVQRLEHKGIPVSLWPKAMHPLELLERVALLIQTPAAAAA